MNVRRYLAGDEASVLEARRHVVVLWRPFAAALAGVVGATAAGFLSSPNSEGDVIDVLGGIVALVLVVRLAWRTWEWSAARLVVTDERILEVSGILTRKVAAMPLSRVTDMTYRRTIGGRLLGYGELIVESAGQDQALGRIRYIPDPDRFYRTLTSLVTAGLPSLLTPQVRDEVSLEDEDTGPLPQVIV